VKTSELIGPALDWAVAKCEGYNCFFDDDVTGPWLAPQEGYLHDEKPLSRFIPSTSWNQAGPIIEREKIGFDTEHGDPWRARFGRARITFDGRAHHYHHADGPTPLIAAMRCYVASKLGDEIEIPEELK
jgi:Protein of unknown function (DUF2591)